MFHPALTTSASERMKTRRFSYFAGFAARERMREAKPVKRKKVAFSHSFDTLRGSALRFLFLSFRFLNFEFSRPRQGRGTPSGLPALRSAGFPGPFVLFLGPKAGPVAQTAGSGSSPRESASSRQATPSSSQAGSRRSETAFTSGTLSATQAPRPAQRIISISR